MSYIQDPNNPDRWIKREDGIDLNTFNNDLSLESQNTIRYFSKGKLATVYLPINNTNNIYPILSATTGGDYGILNNTFSVSSQTHSNLISPSNIDGYTHSNFEYNYTLKNLFTPTRIINDPTAYQNLTTVDVCSLTAFSDLSIVKSIDNINLIEGHTVLIRNQIATISLSSSVAPDNYFNNNFYIQGQDPINTLYYYYNKDNGIYNFTNNQLVRSNLMSSYDYNVDLAISVKLGSQADQEFTLSRKKDGTFPTTATGSTDNIEFLSSNSQILRNKLEYFDVLEANFYDIIHTTASISGSFSLQEKSIIVGDFGLILNEQNGRLNIVNNKYKFDLKSVALTDTYYFMCGSNGTLLRMKRTDFTIEHISIPNEFNTLNSIAIFQNRGFIVGDFNTIYYSFNVNGLKWIKLTIPQFNDIQFHKVVFTNNDNSTVYISGSNGFFVKVFYDSIAQDFVVTKIDVTKIPNNGYDFNYIIKDTINDMKFVEYNNILPWNLTFSSATSSVINQTKDLLFLVGDNNLVCAYNLNNFTNNTSYTQDEFVFFSFSQSVGDVKSIDFYNDNLILGGDNVLISNINSFTAIGLTSNIISGSYSTLYTQANDKSYVFNNNLLYVIGSSSLLLKTTFTASGTNPLVNIDSQYGASFSPRLPFLDYDIASKLDFYDQNTGEYRLPNSVIVSTSSGTVSVTSLVGEVSWIDYDKDINKQYSYSTANPFVFIDNTNVQQYNTIFNLLTGTQNNTVSILAGTYAYNTLTAIQPYIYGGIYATPSSTPALFLYNDLMILIADHNFSVTQGDIISMSSSSLTDNFMVNKIISNGSNNSIYMYTEFDDAIIDNIVTSAQSIIFTNLNKYALSTDLVNNFNKHNISQAYGATGGGTNSLISIYPVYNDKTSYYNLQVDVNFITSTGSFNSNMIYDTKFIKFGYTPQYSLLNYLGNINPHTFTASKTFDSLPRYTGFITNTNTVDFSTNLIQFNPNFKEFWDTFMVNTFIDINVYGNAATVNNTDFLIISKYYDSINNLYVLFLNKKIDQGSITTTSTIDILSRNSLAQVSLDLQKLNNIQRSSSLKILDSSRSITNLKSELNARFDTDSYTKALLNDSDIKSNLTGIIYTDYKNELALNITSLQNEEIVNIISTTGVGGSASFVTIGDMDLNNGDQVIINLNTLYNPQYNGVQVVNSIISSNQFVINVPVGIIGVSESGILMKNISDPYLDYIPVDIIKVGSDKMTKQSILITEDNLQITGQGTYSLINIDYNDYGFRMIDGLNLEIVNKQFSWLLESDIQNALIGYDGTNLIWYSGIALYARFIGPMIWYSGQIFDGYVDNTTMYSVQVTDLGLSASVNMKISDVSFTQIYGGNFTNTNFTGGTFYGNFTSGNFNGAIFGGGEFTSATASFSIFSGGTLVTAICNNCIFNSDISQLSVVSAQIVDSDFQNGIIYSSIFSQSPNGLALLGSKSSNSQPTLFYGGKILNSNIFANLITDTNGNYINSIDHQVTKIYSGEINNCICYGGSYYSTSMKNSTFNSGIFFDNSVIGIDTTSNTITLMGTYRFNIGDTITFIDNDLGNTFSYLGTNTSPGIYTINNITFDINDNTQIVLNKSLSGVSATVPTNTGISFVSLVDNTIINNALIYNIVFRSGKIISSMFLNGSFMGGDFNL
jgi:hypothetical protein